MAFRIGIVASSPRGTASRFLARKLEELSAHRIEVPLIVHDQNTARSATPVRHLVKLARRQARITERTVIRQIANIIVFKLATATRTRPGTDFSDVLRNVGEIVKVDTVNSPEAVAAIRRNECDLVCLMGSRILTRSTLNGIACPVLNIHSSDPRFVRGGPPVFWEILDGRTGIGLTIHHVTEALDSGGIVAEEEHEIVWRPGLGSTIGETVLGSKDRVVDLFAAAIIDIASGNSAAKEFVPGPLKVTPDFTEILRAQRICRRNSQADAG